MSTTARKAATAVAWVTAGAIGATVLSGVASAGSFGPAAVPSGTAAAAATADTAAGKARRGMMRDVLHGSLTVKTDTGTKVVDVQRGEITAASATSVTVKSSDGFTATYAIGDSTVVRRDRSTVSGTDLVVGDTALVRASAGTADTVRALSPDALAKLKDRVAGGRAGMGGMGGMGAGMAGMGGGMGAGMGLDDDDV
ncbi:hypothetical protein [Longivirga aurantiaca]|uniref:DUF5666 domain-containing protein n=1 Tax=Longivirga aurantiaca TaxID=1837743 RepID=A0ABW1SZK6_9ACTN